MNKYIINVAPLTYIPRPHSSIFSYESDMDLQEGSLVNVPLGRRAFSGIVLKNKDHIIPRHVPSLKSINFIVSIEPVINSNTLKLVEWVSRYYITPLGFMFKNALSDIKKGQIITADTSSAEGFSKKYTFGSKRFKEYSKYINKTIKQGKNIILMVPTIKQVSGIEEKFAFLIRKYGVNRILVGTRKILFAPTNNLGLIIVEDENSPFHKQALQHPKYDAREAAEMLARLASCTIMFGGQMPSAKSTYFLNKESLNINTAFDKKVIVIDNLRANNIRFEKYPFSRSFLNGLDEIIKNGGRALIVSARKGDAGGLICKECKEIIKCPSCSSPLSLHSITSKSNKNLPSSVSDEKKLICRYCGKMISAPKTCANCEGWQFKTIGLTTNQIASCLEKLFNSAKIFTVDATIANESKRRKIVSEFNDSSGAILITTKVIIEEYLKPLDFIGLPNIDQFLTIPNFQAEEWLFDMIQKLKTFLKKHGRIFINTYKANQDVLGYIAADDLRGFIKNELKLRKELDWPPFTKLIKITAENTKEERGRHALAILLKDIRAMQREQKPKIEISGPYPAFIHKMRGRYRWHILLKESIGPKDYLNTALQERLAKLIPANLDIDVNPESIL